jgi:membrane protein implicated in regulation of membrane protease activity
MGAFFFFAFWLISPYVILSATPIFLRPTNQPSFHWFVVAALVSTGGILLLSDVIFWHKDAQGAIAMLLVPIFQGIAFVVLLPLAMWASRYVRT